MTTLAEKVAARTVLDPETGCLLWQGALSDNGYAHVWIDGRVVLGHRAVYELLVGPIPEGHQIDHVADRGCRHRHCLNTDHMEPVTQRENILRGSSPPAQEARQTECLRGHDLADDVYVTTTGRRQCRTCRRIRRAGGAR